MWRVTRCEARRSLDVPVWPALFFRFGDLDVIELRPPAPVRRLVRAVLDTPDAGWSPDDGDKDEIAEFVTDMLVKQKGEMLNVYFGLRFDAANEALETLPELLDHYVPNLKQLGMFLLRLAIQADWTSEESCFHTVAKELAEYYMVRPGATTGDCLPKELREYAAGAAVEGDRGRHSHVSGAGVAAGAAGAEEEAEQMAEARDGVAAGGAAAAHDAGADGSSTRAQASEQGADGHAQVALGAEGGAGENGKLGADDSEMALQEGSPGGGEWRWCVQHVLFPAMRYLVLPPRVAAHPTNTNPPAEKPSALQPCDTLRRVSAALYCALGCALYCAR